MFVSNHVLVEEMRKNTEMDSQVSVFPQFCVISITIGV